MHALIKYKLNIYFSNIYAIKYIFSMIRKPTKTIQFKNSG